MVAMMSVNPELAKSMPSDTGSIYSPSGRPGSVYSPHVESPGGAKRHASIGSRRSFLGGAPGEGEEADEDADDDEEIRVGHNFTFIPPNPKKFYRRLVEHCLITDLEFMSSSEVDDTDEVPLSILSPPHVELVNECALRWRISHTYRATCFLDLIKQLYERSEVPIECVPDALQGVTKILNDLEIDMWPISDVRCECIRSDHLLSLLIVRTISNNLRWSLYHLPFFSISRDGRFAKSKTQRRPAIPLYS